MKTIIAAFLFAGSQTAAAAESPCMTRTEFNDMSLFVLPALLDGAAAKCQAYLPANAYLLTGGRTFASRLKVQSDARAEEAIAGFVKIGGSKLPEGVSGATLGSFIRDMARSEPFKKIGAGECATIDEASELLAPLPPENLANLVRLLITQSTKKDKNPPFRFCPTEAM
ncbi:hypothetical protein [Allosphingosinicella deserti]|uniref:Rap1a immunity protein domain-containing protein n=1 Tax=Allosphingosinicella deserti TaxID=2116704 RepID=A0A2P7QH18_9SPHN|nr:hypothetical protein [Sphingomonas deserti]PSJ37233.1 hypothetical protein C7I55_22120 [Sphingomonas deserti]